MILQKLQYNQAPTLGSKCQIILTSVCCLSVSLDQEAADSNRAVHRWPVTHSDTINLHSPESLKDIEIQLCYTKSYCQDLNLSQRTSGNQLSHSVQVKYEFIFARKEFLLLLVILLYFLLLLCQNFNTAFSVRFRDYTFVWV